MADLQGLLIEARKLGESLARSAAVARLLKARQQVEKDQPAQEILKAYEQQAMHVRKLMIEQKPIEPADKQKLAKLEADMAGNAVLKEFIGAQADYAGFINQIRQAITLPLNEALGPAGINV